MCERVIYEYNRTNVTVGFSQAQAKLPVKLRDGNHKLFMWGNRDAKLTFPVGPSVNHEDIKSGRYDQWFPKPIKLPIKAFIAHHIDGTQRWFHLPWDKWIQGMLAWDEIGYRVYIVTLLKNDSSSYSDWPRVRLG